MSGKVTTLRTRLAWHEALICLAVGAIGYASGAWWTAVLCTLGTGIAFGVWGIARLLGALLEQQQTRDEEPATRRRRPAGSAAP